MNVSDEPNNTGSDADATAEEETRNLNTSDESSHSDDSSESDGEQPFASLSIPEKLIDNPSLGLFDRLPKELRDIIYDLCHQEKRYNIGLNDGRTPGTLRLRINAPNASDQQIHQSRIRVARPCRRCPGQWRWDAPWIHLLPRSRSALFQV